MQSTKVTSFPNGAGTLGFGVQMAGNQRAKE
jgi:hypothetical protein